MKQLRTSVEADEVGRATAYFTLDEWDQLTNGMTRAELAELLGGITVHSISAYRARKSMPYYQFYKLGVAYVKRIGVEPPNQEKRAVLKVLRREQVLDKYFAVGDKTAYVFNAKPPEPVRETRLSSLSEYSVEELLNELQRRNALGDFAPGPNIRTSKK